MTPKEKANKLVNNFYLCMPFKDIKLTSCDENKDLIIKMELLSAKQCALIAVDEIIAENKLFPYNTIFYERINFWQEVKQEIEKL